MSAATMNEMDRLRRERDEARAERDALAAHVERARPMVEAYRSQLGGALWSLDDEEAEYAKDAEDWLSSNPTTSLARRDAEVAHSVLSHAAAKAPPEVNTWLNALAEDYRRPAKEPRHE